MLKRQSVIIAAIAATVGVGAIAGPAYAGNDALLGAVLGAGVGAAIGHSVQGRSGAAVGGAIGAIAGASIAANSSSYYDAGYYGTPDVAYGPAPVYYETAPVYYQATPAYFHQAVPAYYPRPRVAYAPRFDYVHYNGHRDSGHDRIYDHGRPGGRDDGGHRGH